MSETPSTAPASTTNDASTASAPTGSGSKDTLLIVFTLVFLSGPFVFTLHTWIGLALVTVTTVALVFLLRMEETVVDRLSKGEDRFAVASPVTVEPLAAATSPEASGGVTAEVKSEEPAEAKS